MPYATKYCAVGKFITLKMDCFEEYKGFLEVAFAIHPCYTVFFGLTAPATALGVLVNCFVES